jgi:hypothetical protein
MLVGVIATQRDGGCRRLLFRRTSLGVFLGTTSFAGAGAAE